MTSSRFPLFFLFFVFQNTLGIFRMPYYSHKSSSSSNFIERWRTGAEVANYSYVEKTINVPLDHFSFSSNVTFKMRYLINDKWFKNENAPIFFYTGNEGYIETFAQNTGFMWESAPDFGALLIFAEHRYYGKSFPTGNVTFSEPTYAGYLNSQQAMADFVELIKFLKEDKKYRHSPVIVFGGSYGGMLSAWIRMKYPHIVHGAIASSAPILQFTGITECETFGQIVSSVFRTVDRNCWKSISKSWAAIDEIVSTDNGKKWINENWKLCSPLSNASDVKDLKDWLGNVYSYLTMINYPYPTDFIAPVPGNPVAAFCKKVTNSSLSGKASLEQLFNGISVYTNYTGQTKCNDYKSDGAENLHADGWPFQACTEMVMPMCTDGVKDMFPPVPWNLQDFSNKCFEKFKVRPDPDLACLTYGCVELSHATNIIFSNGLLDPWSGGGVLKNLSSSAIALIIPEGAHHLDLRASHPKDPHSVGEARKFIRLTIAQWIKEYHAKTRTNHF